MAADLAEAVADAGEDIWEAEEIAGETAVLPSSAAPVKETVAETASFSPNNDEAEPLAIFQQQMAATDDDEPLAIFQLQMADDEMADEMANEIADEMADEMADEVADGVAHEVADEADALTALSKNIASAEEDEALAALQDTLFTPPPANTLLSADESDALAALLPNEANTADHLSAIISSIDEEVDAAYGDDAYSDDVMADLSSERLASPLYNLRQYVIFTLAGETYAAPASHVREVAQLTAVTRIPNVPNWLMGVTNLRGDVLSLIGLRAFLGLGNNGPSDHNAVSDGPKSNGRHDNQIMVVQSEKLTSAITTGLVVDEIQDIRFLNTDQIGTLTAPIEDQVAPFLEGVYEENGRLLVLLDLEKLLLSPAIWQFDLA
jgi:purine-binding chemotaxis protein CheW